MYHVQKQYFIQYHRHKDKFVYVPSNKKSTIHTALNHHYMFIIMFGANTDCIVLREKIIHDLFKNKSQWMDVWLNTNYGGYMIYSNNFVSKYRNILKIKYKIETPSCRSMRRVQCRDNNILPGVVAGIYLYCGLQVIHVSGY